MMNMDACLRTVPLLVAGALVFAGCKVDPDYDFSQLDTSGRILPGLSIPVGSFQQFSLEELLNTAHAENLDVMNVDDAGNYFLDVSLFSWEFDSFRTDWDSWKFKSLSETDSTPGWAKDAYLLEKGTPLDDDMLKNLPFSCEFNFELYSDDVPASVTAVQRLESKGKLSLSFAWKGLPFRNVRILSGTRIILPSWISVSGIEDSRFVLDGSGRFLTLQEDVTVAQDADLTLSCSSCVISEIPDNQGIVGVGAAYLAGRIQLDGSLSLIAEDFTGATRTVGDRVFVVEPTPLSLSVSCRCDTEELRVSRAVIRWDSESLLPDFGETVDVRIEGIPDFLGDAGSSLVFSGAEIVLSSDTRLPMDIRLGGKVELSKEGVLTHAYTLSGLDYSAGSSHTDYVFNETGSGPRQGVKYKALEGISSFLSPLPDAARLSSIRVETDPDEWIDIAADAGYGASFELRLQSPLRFSSQSRLVFPFDIRSLNFSYDAAVTSAEISMMVTNTIPFGFTLTLNAMDEQGTPIPSLHLSTDCEIAAGSPEKPVSTPVVIRAESAEGIGFDGLHFELEAVASADEIALNKKQGLEISDVVIRLPEGIRIH